MVGGVFESGPWRNGKVLEAGLMFEPVHRGLTMTNEEELRRLSCGNDGVLSRETEAARSSSSSVRKRPQSRSRTVSSFSDMETS